MFFYVIFIAVPVHSCEPSLDCHIKIIEVLVTSEMSENQAAPGTSLLHSLLFYQTNLLMVLVFSTDGRKQNDVLNQPGTFSGGPLCFQQSLNSSCSWLLSFDSRCDGQSVTMLVSCYPLHPTLKGHVAVVDVLELDRHGMNLRIGTLMTPL